MCILYNSVRWINRRISEIWKQTNRVWWQAWMRIIWMFLMRIKETLLMTVLNHLSSPTPREIIFRGLWQSNVFSTTFMGRNVDGLRPMYASLITMKNFLNITMINRANLQSSTPIWVIGGIVDGLKHISNYALTINTCYIIYK